MEPPGHVLLLLATGVVARAAYLARATTCSTSRTRTGTDAGSTGTCTRSSHHRGLELHVASHPAFFSRTLTK